MNAAANPVGWLLWSLAAMFVVITTRNPLYLALASAAFVAVYLAMGRRSVAGAAWGAVLRIGLAVAFLNIAFNLLTVHAGDRVVTRLPSEIPIFGGAITLNALVYGVVSAVVLLDLLLIAAIFSTAVSRAALLRLLPGQFAALGVAGIVALSFLPQMLRALTEVREAQAARGFRVRSVRDLPPLVVPILHLGLERAFDLAEAMESRAFGSAVAAAPSRRAFVALGLALTVCAVVFAALGNFPVALPFGLAALVVLWKVTAPQATARGRYRPLNWERVDGLLLVTSALAIALHGASLVLLPDVLAYYPYPRLTAPLFALWPGIASLLLVVPALVGVRHGAS